ncbi:hypothetical protein, conserved [Plasmodium gonderi]|uniref:Methyltransferase domain-containing protein n=1 Tax=Plasmodium gonderi TaxID=77519 RepID=A0A1Y1JMJ4_PLAGO|nr:hypothetical protein, conserved [Plasmodium gonderi]GAW81254.1 hypothetical protein, conserved [Plasmodium gonderi]
MDIIENEIAIYEENKTHFEALSRFSKPLNHNFTDFVHLICKVKNVRKHGKLLHFCDTISNGKINKKRNVLFYKYHILNHNKESVNEIHNYKNDDDKNDVLNFCIIENKFNEESLSTEKNVQLVISKDFYIDEEKFNLFGTYLLKKVNSENKDNSEITLGKEFLEYSVHLSKNFYANLKKCEDEETCTNNDIFIKDNPMDDIENPPLLLMNEYIKYEIVRKIIKTDTLVYIIGLPVLTNTNEKSILVFSSYLLKVNDEFFNVNELFKLFEGGFFSMLMLCRSLRVKKSYIQELYNSNEDKKRKCIRNIVYKNKNYKSICNQKMNNFEIFIIKIIDIIPKLFEIRPSEFNYTTEMNCYKRMHKIILCDLNMNNSNEHLLVDARRSGNTVEQKKRKKKKKRKKDIISYMNNKKVPQIQWMINHIKVLLESIDKGNSKMSVFKGEDIILHISILVNKYIESNDTFFENYLEYIELLMEKNEKLVSSENVKKIKNNIEILREKNVNLFENSKWNDIQFYNINEFYMNHSTESDIDMGKNCKTLIEEGTNMIYDCASDGTCEDKQILSKQKERKDFTDFLPKLVGGKTIDRTTLTYDYCILDVGGGKGDLGIHISLAFKNVLVIILDINVNSLFSCFIKIFANKIKNVLIMHESILNFDFNKYKINLIVGLHCCGGLTDYTLRKCMEEKIPFLICSCCYTKYRELRKYIFDFNNDIILNEIKNYIYNKNYYPFINYNISNYTEETGETAMRDQNVEDKILEDSDINTDHFNIHNNSKKGISCANCINRTVDISNINTYAEMKSGDTKVNGNDFTWCSSKCLEMNQELVNTGSDGFGEKREDQNDEICESVKNDDDEGDENGKYDEFSMYKKKYDKYGKKIMRRTIPNIYSFVNLLSKLCESENTTISFKCMHFYNNLRFQILQKLSSASKGFGEKGNINLSLHSFPISFSPKNIVLRGTFS